MPRYLYATVDDVLARVSPDFVTSGAITTAAVRDEIETVSVFINELTEQVFQPTFERVVTTSRNDFMIAHPQNLPIVDLVSVSAIVNRETGMFRGMNRIIPGMNNRHAGEVPTQTLNFFFRTSSDVLEILDASGSPKSTIAWERGKRFLRTVSKVWGLPSGVFNIETLAWWGWLDEYKYVETEVSTPPATDPVTTLTVGSITNPDTGDAISVGDTIVIILSEGSGGVPKKYEFALVKSITPNGTEFDLTVDDLTATSSDLPQGTKIRCYGAPPAAIRKVATTMAANRATSAALAATGNNAASAAINGNLRSERTDNYSYTIGPVDYGVGDGLGRLTGDPILDSILVNYSRPVVSIRYF